MSRDNNVTRRSILSTVGGLGTCGVAFGTASAKPSPELPENDKKKFKRKYGKESKQIIATLRPLYDQYKSGKLTHQELYNSATFEFLTSADTPKIRRDVIESWKTMPRAHRPENPVIKKHTDIEVGKAFGKWVQKAPITNSYEETTLFGGKESTNDSIEAQTNTVQYRWNKISQDHGASGAGTADTFVHQYVGDETSYPGRQKEKATVGVYGSAWAEVSFWRRFIPANDGSHTIQVKAANIRGNGTTGSTTFSIWAENPDGNRNTKQAGSVTTTDGVDKYYYKDFSFDSGKEYKIGFQIYGTTQTAGGAGTSDYYSDNRGVTPNYQQSQYPEYYFEVKTP